MGISSPGKLYVCPAHLVTRREIIPHLPTRAIPDLPLSLSLSSIPSHKSLSPSPQSPSPPLLASPKPLPPPPSLLLLPRSLLFTRLERRLDAIPSLGGKESLAGSDFSSASCGQSDSAGYLSSDILRPHPTYTTTLSKVSFRGALPAE